ncbi:hypothetical protein CRENBAI_012056 [Crenichthys baileyi]|uniref:Uncharacterized protein n=1 Tax=Crenichthys baileyi TaxID=28760 RepID=A0AAV9QQN0_9TELE
MSGKAIHLAQRLKVAGDDELSPKELIDGEEKNLLGGKSSLFYLSLPFEGDVNWQGRRGSKINVAKGGSDSLSAGCGSLGWPDWSWMSLLLLNLEYVNRADSGGAFVDLGRVGVCLLDNNRKDKL